MTPEAQRIAIAEACGWQVYYEGKVPYISGLDHPDWSQRTGPLPDYLEDLNAMHEAEKVLTREEGETYAGKLCDMVDRFDGDAWKHSGYALAHATATQRAEAFLHTKWLEIIRHDRAD